MEIDGFDNIKQMLSELKDRLDYIDYKDHQIGEDSPFHDMKVGRARDAADRILSFLWRRIYIERNLLLEGSIPSESWKWLRPELDRYAQRMKEESERLRKEKEHQEWWEKEGKFQEFPVSDEPEPLNDGWEFSSVSSRSKLKKISAIKETALFIFSPVVVVFAMGVILCELYEKIPAPESWKRFTITSRGTAFFFLISLIFCSAGIYEIWQRWLSTGLFVAYIVSGLIVVSFDVYMNLTEDRIRRR